MDICLYFPTPYPTPTPSVCLENIPLTVEAGKLDCGHAVGLGLAGQMHMGAGDAEKPAGNAAEFILEAVRAAVSSFQG